MCRPIRGVLVVTAMVAILAGCRDSMSWQSMAKQPRYDALEPSTFFPDGRSAREPVPGTVARGQLVQNALPPVPVHGGAGQHTHDHGGSGEADALPFPLTRAVLERGRERFDIFCSPCHGRTGDGDGLVVRRGFTRPPSFHTEGMRAHAMMHYVRVMTAGFGAMPDYAKQIPVADRWAIAAYIRALQLSQHAPLAAVPPEARAGLGAVGAAR